MLGTTISVIVVPQAIVVAADGKTTQYLSNQRVPSIGRVSKKLRIMRNGMIVGSYGMAKIGPDPHPAYYLGTFFDSIEKEIGAKLSVAPATNIIRERAAFAMSRFNDVLASGAVARDTLIKQTGRDNPLSGFVVAGYESGHAMVFKIEVEIDWNLNRLREPVVTPLYPSATTNMFSSDAPNVGPRLPAWSNCRVPKTVANPILQTETMARAVVDLGIEMNADNVGLPITLVTLFPDGHHRIKRYSSRLPDLCVDHADKSK